MVCTGSHSLFALKTAKTLRVFNKLPSGSFEMYHVWKYLHFFPPLNQITRFLDKNQMLDFYNNTDFQDGWMWELRGAEGGCEHDVFYTKKDRA